MRPEIDAAVARVLDSGWFILGPEGEALERELAAWLGAREVVAVGNGTEAIQLALEGLGIGAGDEVITSPLTAAFTALAVMRAGARPVFADLDPRTLNVDPAAVAAAITSRTKAILPVHLYGHPADLDPLMALGRERRIAVIEDACQAIGASYKGRRVGALTGIGALSFYPTKNLGALGDGGAVVLQDAEVAARHPQAAQRRPERPLPARDRGDEQPSRRDAGGHPARRAAPPGGRGPSGAARSPAATSRASKASPAWSSRAISPTPRPRTTCSSCATRGATRWPRASPSGAWARSSTTRSRSTCSPRSLGSAAPGAFPVAEKAAGEILSLPLYPEMSDAQADAVIEAVRAVAGSLP